MTRQELGIKRFRVELLKPQYSVNSRIPKGGPHVFLPTKVWSRVASRTILAGDKCEAPLFMLDN